MKNDRGSKPQGGPAGWVQMLLVLPCALIGGAELAMLLGVEGFAGPVGALWVRVLHPYHQVRGYVLYELYWLAPVVLVGVVLLVLVLRVVLTFWYNRALPRLVGASTAVPEYSFPKLKFDLAEQLRKRPPGHYFIGLDERKRPCYLTESDLDTHGHIMGHTGSGKTRSVLEPLMLQDMARGKGLLFMDAKGSSENVSMMRSLARMAGRTDEVKVFALAHPKWSHTYNPVHLSDSDDPLAVAERVFSVFPLENEYYRGQSKLFFYSLIRLMAGTGERFNLVDLRLAVADPDVLDHVFGLSDDRRAKYEITRQMAQLGRKRNETFTGLYNALAEYDHPLLNAYEPDIVLEDILENRGMVYFNLPANRYAMLAPAVGKIVLQHLKAVASLRQIDRDAHDQTPFAVNIDELNRFAFPELVPSLAMLRDAHVQYRLAHQSLGDLEQVSPVFAQQVKDNTRWKVFLFENDPEHLEKVSRSFGTRTTFKRTVRFSLGPLFTFLNTGEVSNREVEEFVLHPNSLKSLAPRGQGYLLLPEGAHKVSFGLLPRAAAIPIRSATGAKSYQRGLNLVT